MSARTGTRSEVAPENDPAAVEFPNEQVVRIGSGQGFWGDWQEAPKLQVRCGTIDYLMLDYLAEITMSIMQKQKERSPDAGYAKDFVSLMVELAADLVDRNVRCLLYTSDAADE